jgi:hypothetical protein
VRDGEVSRPEKYVIIISIFEEYTIIFFLRGTKRKTEN